MSVPSVQTAAQQWIETLIGFDTTSAHSNLGLIETVRDDLARRGCKSILTFDAENRKANLFCTIPDARGEAGQKMTRRAQEPEKVPLSGSLQRASL